MSDDYFKTNPGVKDLPCPRIEPQPPSPQTNAITIRPQQWMNYASAKLSIWLMEDEPLMTQRLKKLRI